MTALEQPLPGPAAQVLLSNLWNAARMFHWNDGEIWVNSVMRRPALDVVTAALFTLGMALAAVRYARTREWVYLFLLLSIPLLQLPSSLSLAFPNENPAINRAGGAMIPVFLLAALAVDGWIAAVERAWTGARRAALLVAALVLLLTLSLSQNYDLVFRQYADTMKQSIWNTSDMGRMIEQFAATYGSDENVWIVPYPYWVDTRLPGAYMGRPYRDFALWAVDLRKTLAASGPKLFILKPEDEEAAALLRSLYPQGAFGRFDSDVPGHDFITFFVPLTQPAP
jgi:hypothetical protein